MAKKRKRPRSQSRGQAKSAGRATGRRDDRARRGRQPAASGRWRGIVIGLVVVGVIAAAVWAIVLNNRNVAQARLEAGKVADDNVGETARDTVTIKTSRGDVVLRVYPELMPGTVANFEKLAGEGFYDGLIWHRVEDWVVQTGDPLGTGMGGSGETIDLETNPRILNTRGAVGMARGEDRDSATSQFYILKQDADWLDGDYAAFGYVVEGLAVIDSLQAGDQTLEVTVEQDGAGE